MNETMNNDVIIKYLDDTFLPTRARLAQLVERKALNLVVVGSSPTVGENLFLFILFFIQNALQPLIFFFSCFLFEQFSP